MPASLPTDVPRATDAVAGRHATPLAPDDPRAPRRIPPPERVVDWDALEPRGAYARVGRPLLQALVVLALLPPALAAGAGAALLNWAVFRDPRAILYSQTRVGRRCRRFRIWKFRTMRAAHVSDHASWEAGTDALRVTPLGRFLRSTHLDELPQLWNVLRGDMALIGPRPEMVEIEEWARARVPGFSLRLAIRPGLTGLAQVTQGYTSSDADAYAEKLRINLEYLERMSLRLDVEIVVRTVVWMLLGRGWSWRRHPGARRPPPPLTSRGRSGG